MANKKQKPKSQGESGKGAITWRGQVCEIVGNEPIVCSDGTLKMCAKIKVYGLPLHQALRLVGLDELESE